MSNISACGQSESNICDLFRNMNFSPAVESDETALTWLRQYGGKFRGFVQGHSLNSDTLKNGKQANLEPNTICDDNGKKICCVYTCKTVYSTLLSHAAEVTDSSFSCATSISPSQRSKILLSIAENLEKHKNLFAYLESLSGKPISKTKSKDFPHMVETFRYSAGAALCDEFVARHWFPQGPVCVVAEEHHNPLLMLGIRIGSLLASGSSILVLCHWKSFLSVFLLAEICCQSGVPGGVFNVVPVSQKKHMIPNSLFRKLIFSGSMDRCLSYSQLCSETHIPREFLILKRPVVIVYEDSDLHSAANGVLEAFFYHDTRSCSGGCKVMIQESISEKFLKILTDYFEKILVGQNMSYSDMSGIVTEEQEKELSKYIKEAEKFNGKVTRVSSNVVKKYNYCHMLPVLISNLPTSFKLVHDELGGPVIVTTLFRTVKESISMFNCDNRGSPASIWSEKISVALEVASQLKTAVVWVNSQNQVDPTVPFSGIYMSGNSVEGGKDGYYSHISPVADRESQSDQLKKYNAWLAYEKLSELISPGKSKERSDETHSKDIGNSNASGKPMENVTRKMQEYKLFIGGSLIPSSGGLAVLDDSTAIPSGTESDIQKAVSSALAAQPAWEKLGNSERRKVIFSIFKQLQLLREKLIVELQEHTSLDKKAIQSEIDETLAVLHKWAVKFEESAYQEKKKNMVVLQTRCPRGVIGIQCPDENPLLSFVSLVISAISHGNTVVAVASSKYPTIALRMSEVFLSANVPAGVINTICGNKTLLVPAFCKHTDVNAIWFSDAPIKVVYSHCNVTQRVFNCNGIWNDFNYATSFKCTLESTFSKVIYLPFGEIFAN